MASVLLVTVSVLPVYCSLAGYFCFFLWPYSPTSSRTWVHYTVVSVSVLYCQCTGSKFQCTASIFQCTFSICQCTASILLLRVVLLRCGHFCQHLRACEYNKYLTTFIKHRDSIRSVLPLYCQYTALACYSTSCGWPIVANVLALSKNAVLSLNIKYRG